MGGLAASVTRTALAKQPVPDAVLFLFILLRLPQQLYITEHLEVKSVKPFLVVSRRVELVLLTWFTLHKEFGRVAKFYTADQGRLTRDGSPGVLFLSSWS